MNGVRKFAVASVAGLVLSLGVVGCESQHPSEIPSQADLKASGDRQVVWTAPSDGMVYIYDQQNNRLLWSGQVSQGKVVKADPSKNQIMVNDSLVASRTLEPYHNVQIWFDRNSNNLVNTSSSSSQSQTYTAPATQPSQY